MATQAQNVQVTKPGQKKDIRDFLQSDAVKNQLAMVLPKYLTPDRMARVTLTAILKNPKLLECRPESLLQAMMLCSQAGLEPDGRNAHLIPYKDIVQVIFDYKGLVAIAERNGVQNIYADKVCDNDIFDAIVEDGVKKITHRIDWKKPRGDAYAYYASCRRNGLLDYEVMTKDDVDKIRKRSRASGDGPWVTDYDEMAKKTVLRRMSKRWDLSVEVADVVNNDDDRPTDIPKRPVFTGDPFAAQLPEPPPTTETPNTGKGTDANQPSNVTPLPTEAPKSDDGDLGPQGKTTQPPGNPPPQDVSVPEAAVPITLEIIGFKQNKEGGEDETAAWKRFCERVRALLVASNVTEPQFMAWLGKNQLAKGNQKLDDLTASKLVGVVKKWANVLPDIAKEAK